jgi:hypothetical protein
MGRWVRYRDGKTRAKLKIEVLVEKELVQWLVLHTAMTERAALAWLKLEYARHGIEKVEFGSIAVDEVGDPILLDRESCGTFAGEVYPG